jgi:hypothetical protein
LSGEWIPGEACKSNGVKACRVEPGARLAGCFSTRTRSVMNSLIVTK